MAININVDPSNQLTFFTAAGELSFDEVIKSIASFYNTDPTLNVLYDLSRASLSEISSSQVRDIARFVQTLRKSREGGKTAIVSTTDLNFGMARMLQIFTTNSDQDSLVEMRVFRDIKEASLWLKNGSGP